MSDMEAAIKPKSDQLNADDLITGPRTITITGVDVKASPEQPVSVRYEGDGGKPWKPCKSMCRVMVEAWGADSSQYAGKRLTLYRDPEVTFGGMKVGGIRISAMSGIDRDMRAVLTVSKAKRATVTIKRLEPAADKAPPTPEAIQETVDLIAGADTQADLRGLWKMLAPDLKQAPQVIEAAKQRHNELLQPTEDDQ